MVVVESWEEDQIRYGLQEVMTRYPNEDNYPPAMTCFSNLVTSSVMFSLFWGTEIQGILYLLGAQKLMIILTPSVAGSCSDSPSQAVEP